MKTLVFVIVAAIVAITVSVIGLGAGVDVRLMRLITVFAITLVLGVFMTAEVIRKPKD